MFKNLSLFLVGLFAVIPFVSSVVVAPPVVYWVTLSLSTFFANMLVTLFMYAAAKGLATKTFFGKKLSNLLSFMFGMISRFVVAMAASLAALIVINPITINEIIEAGLLSILLFFVLFLLASYREFRVSEKKKRILTSILLFGLLVGALTFVSAYYALEKQVIVGEVAQPAVDAKDVLGDYSAGIAYSSAPMELEKTADVEEKEEELVMEESAQRVFLVPTSATPCTLENMGQTYEFLPRLECVEGYGLSEKRVYCPIEVAVIGEYNVGGSCS